MRETLPEAPPLPWERQTDERGKQETQTAFDAFQAYLYMEGRSLRKLAEKRYGSASKVRRLMEWSRIWNWVDRARAWDDEQAIIRLDARKRAIQRMEDEQAAQAADMENRIVASIMRDLERADEAEEILIAHAHYERTGEVAEGAPEGVEELTAGELQAHRAARISLHQRRLMWEAAGRARRRALGEPETIEEQRKKLSGSVNLRTGLVASLGTDPEFVSAVQDALTGREATLYGDGGPRPLGPAKDRGEPLE